MSDNSQKTIKCDRAPRAGDTLVYDPTLDGFKPSSLGAEAYTPGTSGDWSPAPTTMAEALDQLASRVAALE